MLTARLSDAGHVAEEREAPEPCPGGPCRGDARRRTPLSKAPPPPSGRSGRLLRILSERFDVRFHGLGQELRKERRFGRVLDELQRVDAVD